MPAATVLQSATLEAARIMKKDGDPGSIARGQIADLLLVSGDPSTWISDIRNVKLAMNAGATYSSQELNAAMGLQP
jgi:imidazolonepropionase-like amidohydrolase